MVHMNILTCKSTGDQGVAEWDMEKEPLHRVQRGTDRHMDKQTDKRILLIEQGQNTKCATTKTKCSALASVPFIRISATLSV